MASARSGLGPERPRSPAPAAPTPRARHEAEVAGRRPDLKFAVAAAADLRAAGEVPLGHRRATLDGAAHPHLRHVAPTSGARRCRLPLSAPARRSTLLVAAPRRSLASRRGEKREKGREEMN